ncbi:MAG: hypothetical protein ACIALR_04945 [Blastopirellula sp. JB062]
MLKKVLFAIVPALLMSVSLRADDALELNLDEIKDADVSVIDQAFSVDVDKLASDADGANEDEAIEACFRRIGYRSYGYYGGYGYGYGYRYNCYRPYFACYRPVYYAPVCYSPSYVSYWGCY